jgi:hypothetical protein
MCLSPANPDVAFETVQPRAQFQIAIDEVPSACVVRKGLLT